MLDVCTGAKSSDQGWRLQPWLFPHLASTCTASAEFVLVLSTGNENHDIWLYVCTALPHIKTNCHCRGPLIRKHPFVQLLIISLVWCCGYLPYIQTQKNVPDHLHSLLQEHISRVEAESQVVWSNTHMLAWASITSVPGIPGNRILG